MNSKLLCSTTRSPNNEVRRSGYRTTNSRDKRLTVKARRFETMNANNDTFGTHSNARGNAAVNTRSTPRKRYAFVDLLNIIACLAVVGLHVSSTVFSPVQASPRSSQRFDLAFSRITHRVSHTYVLHRFAARWRTRRICKCHWV